MKIRTLIVLVAMCAGIRAYALQVQIWQWGNPTCGNNTGYAIAQAGGGTWPYTYSWSNGATTDTITGLAPGFYEVTVTDALSATATANITLSNQQVPYLSYAVGNAGLHGCGASCNSGVRWLPAYAPLNLVQPFTFSVPPTSGWNVDMPDEEAWVGLCDDMPFEIGLTDALGCVATLYDYVYPSSDPSPMSVVSVSGACTGSSYGSVTVDVGVDDDSPFGPLWQCSILDNVMQELEPWINATCAPGQNITSVSGLAPGDYYVQRYYFNYTGGCADYIPFTIPDLGGNCGHLSSNSWYNLNADCVRDPNEVGVPNSVFEVQPGPLYFITNGDGTFDVDLPNGSYSIEQLDATLTPGCGVVEPWPFTINSNPINRTWVNTSSEPLDLEVVVSAGTARPGFDQQIHAAVRNLSPQQSGPITLTCVFDAALTFLSATPTPTNVVGNTITWDFAAQNSFGQNNVGVTVNVPVSTPLGTVLQYAFSGSNSLLESSTTNNDVVVSSTVTGSFDPNDKTARTSSGLSDALYIIDQDEYVDYTIRFQNTGTDTAFTVVITDTLEAGLDMSGFEQGVASHPFHVQFLPGRVVKWTFDNILLPDSNVNETASHGLISFRIRPQPPVLPGTVIENIANIYFDFNPPVITEPSVLTAEFSTGIARAEPSALVLSPVPVSDQLLISSDGTIEAITILAADGRAMIRRSVRTSNSAVDVSGLPAGSYFLLATLNTGSPVRVRFIKL